MLDRFRADYDAYARLDAMLPGAVDRELAEISLSAGEPEFAVAALLEDAYIAGFLTDMVVAFVRDEYGGVPALEMLEALLMLQEMDSAA